MKVHISLIFLLLTLSCGQVSKQYKVLHQIDDKASPGEYSLFTLVPSTKSSIDFSNDIEETQDLNFLNFSNIYNGGGVVTADFNNDGLVDIFFVANQLPNKLYINKGSFEFKDVTENSGIKDSEGWSTGASAIDINNDGWLDLYICKSGSLKNNSLRQNKLFINQKDGTFKEEAKKWGVNDPGFSTQSYFLDFDKDGDLDMYLVNHRIDFQNTARLNMSVEKDYSLYTSDKLYRNDGTVFKEITHLAGLVNKAWGLSASIGDFNNDNWPDIYVCNDFLTPDMLYINNHDGTFSNQILDRINHTSFSSMGSDYADINNDLLPDLLVLEMASEDHIRSKENMATMNTKAFWNLVNNGYHHQYMINTLQLNNPHGQFSEIGQLSGIAKTDWSWAPLIADFDNDGYKDVFITNGILKEMGNQDFRTDLMKRFSKGDIPSFKEVTDMLPSYKLNNYSFKNNKDYTFKNTSRDWGFDSPTQSNGVAYADFDNDGDLDLVINNINDRAMLYENNDSNNFIQIQLEGNPQNTQAIGATITISADNNKQYQELYLNRGFLSSVQNILNFGIGNASQIDELSVKWPNGQTTTLKNLRANQIISISQKNAKPLTKTVEGEPNPTLLTQLNPKAKGITYTHTENAFDDFKNQILLPHSQSTNGPFMDKADVNNDGLEDFFIGGAKGQSGELYIQTENGNFSKQASNTWDLDKDYEDLGILFFDIDNDQDKDLYVVSGGSEFPKESTYFQDRIYLNDGKGNFIKQDDALPQINSSGQCVKYSDIDEDGDLDLFVGGRVVPDQYPFSPKSFILLNEDGIFTDKTEHIAPSLSTIGMVTDATFSDYDNDGDEDLIVVGEWMPITVFENIDGKFSKANISSVQDTEGIWFSIESSDIDNDGDIDYFIGNLGLNTKFKASKKKPFHIFCDDFDSSGTYDIVLTNTYKGNLVPLRGRECSSQQMPFIKDKFKTYNAFANASLTDIYGEQNLESALHLESKILASVFMENLGNGQFKIRKLPNAVQLSPIMDFDFIDFDHDGTKEIIAIGNHYTSEVETVRYDASYGSILKYKNDEFIDFPVMNTGFFNKGNSKDIATINSKDKNIIIVTNNNSSPNIFEFRK